MGQQWNIKIVEEMMKRREKGNCGSLDVSPQRTHNKPAKMDSLDVSPQRTHSQPAKMLRWTLAISERTANL